MRVYGRTFDSAGNPLQWVVVETDAQGSNEYVYVTWLIQVLKLVTGESPFYANVGIPAVVTVVTQVFPDWYVSQVQAMFQQYFASLIISKVQSSTPTYNIQILMFNGTTFQATIAA
jgi:hypothetical protein